MDTDIIQCSSDKLDDVLKFQGNNTIAFEGRSRFLYPSVDRKITKLPQKLSLLDKSDFIKISNNNPFQCEYRTRLGGDSDVGSIRSSDPIPDECQIYYYEVLVINRGEGGKIAVGLTAKGTNLNRQPGWDRHTFGYHGDDGKAFRENGYPRNKYGPAFGTNDVIGCGLNLKTRTCFFTKNGKFLGIAFKNMPVISLYPTIGLHSKNEIVRVNLGQHPFIYNVKLEMILNEAHSKDLETEKST